MTEVIQTACVEWSLNRDPKTQNLFWWNNLYSISIWSHTLETHLPHESLKDFDVWQAFIRFQIGSVFKMCTICQQEEGNEDTKVCCYCGMTVHRGCSKKASSEQIEWKPANKGFEAHLRACFSCEGVPIPQAIPVKREKCNARRAAIRALTIRKEYPESIAQSVELILCEAERPHSEEKDLALLASLRRVITSFFQSEASCRFLKTETRADKGGGIGVIASEEIPAYTIVGVYPGYNDALSGEQMKQGRPVVKYALMDLNCADFFNVVFDEFQGTFTPFINEPSETEESNCGWIQEVRHVDGRLSVMTSRIIKKGEELLIGYGPLYPRAYPYRYDALTFHMVENECNTALFALWHWPSLNEADARLECYVRYDKSSDSYYFCDTGSISSENKQEMPGSKTAASLDSSKEEKCTVKTGRTE